MHFAPTLIPDQYEREREERERERERDRERERESFVRLVRKLLICLRLISLDKVYATGQCVVLQ